MTRYDPTHNIFSVDPPNPEDMFKLSVQVEHVSCYHCGRQTAFPVRTEYVDWQNVAEIYRRQLLKLRDAHIGIMADMELIHGVDNPAAVYYRNRIAALLLEIRAAFDGNPRGTSAGMGHIDGPDK